MRLSNGIIKNYLEGYLYKGKPSWVDLEGGDTSFRVRRFIIAHSGLLLLAFVCLLKLGGGLVQILRNLDKVSLLT